MKTLGLWLALGASGICLEARGGPIVCGVYGEAYQKEILPKIQAGVPFELMSALFEDGKLTQKKVVHISYNLWDEVITVKSAGKTAGKFPLKVGVTELCRHLDWEEPAKSGHKQVVRLLLNPLWSERITRLQMSTGGEPNSKRMIGINWQKLADEMPSEKVLLEKEISQ